MPLEFECPHCDAITIFKSLEGLDKKDISCAGCCKRLSIATNLIRFDRSDNNLKGILLSPESTINERLERVVRAMEDLRERVERLEELHLDEHSGTFELDS